MEQSRCQRHESRIADGSFSCAGRAGIATALTDHPGSITGGTLHEEMERRSALGICNRFNASAVGRKDSFLPGLFSLLGFTK